MTDVFTPEKRSAVMRRVKSRDTTPERLARRLLTELGVRYRLHRTDLPGKPDIVLPRYHAVVFVHGCFWHGHDCPLFKWPGTRPDFWREKIGRNQANDNRAREALLANGWRVGIVWECALRGAGKNIEGVAQSLADWLRSDAPLIEVRE